MSKNNSNKNNKKVAILFALIAVVLLFLSFEKISLSKDNNLGIEVDAVETESIKTEIIENNNVEIENDISLENIEELEEKKEINETKTVQEDYLKFDLSINNQKIIGIYKEGDSLYDSFIRMRDLDLIKFEEKKFSSLGSYIYSINNIKELPREGKYWIYYVNGKEGNVGVSNYILKEGDQIMWKLEAKEY